MKIMNRVVERRAEATSLSRAHGLESQFLKGLARADLDLVLAAATPRRFLGGSVVASQGDPADYLFLLTTGCARYFFITPEGRKVLLLWLKPGEIFGAAALLSQPSAYLVSAEIIKDSSVLVWQRTAIRKLAVRHPQLTENALSFASNYLTWYLATHMALISHSASERLAGALVSLAKGVGRRVDGGVKLDITNEELASTANITPFTASRLLSEWQRSGAVLKSRGGIVLRSPEQLFVREI